MLQQLKLFLFKKVSSIGLALFRIVYSLILLFQVIEIFNYRHLYLDQLPYLNPHFLNSVLLFYLWMGIVLFLIFGWFTQTITILNYLFTMAMMLNMTGFSNQMFYVYTGVNFLFLFLPISESLSIDLVRKKLKYIDQGILYTAPKISKLNYFLPVFLGLAIRYFDSAFFYKTQSIMWLEGLGLWLPSSLPHITYSNNQWLLNQELLIKSLSHAVIVFEILFIFLFWYKKFRIPLISIGIGFHIGILIQFPIPYFALGCISFYILLVPISFWDTLWQKIGHKKEKLRLYYNYSSVRAHRFKIIIEFLDVFKRIRFNGFETNAQQQPIDAPSAIRHGELYLQEPQGMVYTGESLLSKIAVVAPLCYLLLGFRKVNLFRRIIPKDFISYSEPIVFSQFPINEESTYQKDSKLRDALLVYVFIMSILFQGQVTHSFFENKATTAVVNRAMTNYFGISPNSLFVDAHFKEYTTIFGLKYKNKFLPLLDENGMPDDYLCCSVWSNFIWKVNMPNGTENNSKLRTGLTNYSSYWSHQNEVNLIESQEFEIVRKKIEVPFTWKKNLLKKNIEAPWENVGKLVWKDKNVCFFWNSNSL